jgi:hydrogenase maturation protease
LVIGVGNPLARDEGLGPRAIERLEKEVLPEGTGCLDAGTDLLGALPDLAAASRVILIDAVRTGAPPGSIHRWTLEELEARAAEAETPALSAHDATLLQAVALARATGKRIPPTVVLGVEVGEVALGEGLTPPVEAALDPLVDAVREELSPPAENTSTEPANETQANRS